MKFRLTILLQKSNSTERGLGGQRFSSNQNPPLGSGSKKMSRSSDSSRFMYDLRNKGCKYSSLERKDPEFKSKSKIPQTGVGDPSKKSYLGDPLFDKVWDYWGFLD